MKIYLVNTEDRHADTTVEPFYNADKAVAEAKRLAKEYCRWDEDYEESYIDGWLFYANYSCEGDCVRVVEAEMADKSSV